MRTRAGAPADSGARPQPGLQDGAGGPGHPSGRRRSAGERIPGATARFARPRSGVDPDRSKSWLRRVLPIIGAHRAQFITALVLAFGGLLIQVQVPDIVRYAIDNTVFRHTVPVHVYVYWLVALGAAGGVMAYFTRLFLFTTAYRIEFDLRNIIYEHLMKMSFSFYDRVQSGQLISRANSDIRSVQMYMTFAPVILVNCTIAFVAFGYMLSISVPLAFVAIAVMPFVFLVGTRMRHVMFPVSWLIQARLAQVATIVDESTIGVRVVKAFAAEPQQVSALAAAAAKLRWSYVKDADLRARWTPLIQNLPQLGLVAVLMIGGYLFIHGHLDPGAILALTAYVLMLQAPFLMLGMLIMMGQRAAASAGRIYEILDQKPAVVDAAEAVALEACKGDVRFDDVHFGYGAGGPDVLAGFDLHVAPGETVALVGRTGSGKSTVARLLARFYDVTGGSIRVDGRDVRELTLESLRSAVGMVLDEAFLFSASIRENIAYGRPDADVADIEAAAIAAEADEFVHELPQGYDTVVGERGYTLSGGQRQRVAIARTLLANPPILVLDDATSSVDVQVEQRIHQALARLLTGRTTIVIAHRLSTIGLADRVVLVEAGRVIAEGTHEELLATTPRYAEVLAQVEKERRDLEEAQELAAAERREAARAGIGRRGAGMPGGAPGEATAVPPMTGGFAQGMPL